MAFLRRREAACQRDLDVRFRTAWTDFDRIVAMIAREFAPRRDQVRAELEAYASYVERLAEEARKA